VIVLGFVKKGPLTVSTSESGIVIVSRKL